MEVNTTQVAESLNRKAIANGLDGLSADSLAELAEQLRDADTATGILNDYEARLGVNVDDEWTAITAMFHDAGLPDRL